ncbi:MAG: hypothetical protein ACE5HV_16465 [Acidobacteriota bacterium]
MFGPRLHLSRPLLGHDRQVELVERLRPCLLYFPELDGRIIRVGITRQADGIAIFEPLTVRFDLRRRLPTNYTIGHELTHLLQALKRVPQGEVQCDIWTLARSRLFTDEVPCYLQLPRRVYRNWRRYAACVRYLCARAISERSRRRTYIRWLKAEMEQLP